MAGEIAQAGPGDVTVDGQNLIGRWTQPLATDSDISLQVYWDRTRRRIPNSITEILNTVDLDLQHRLPLGQRNKFIWCAGYRFMRDEVDNPPAIAFLPGRRDLHLFSASPRMRSLCSETNCFSRSAQNSSTTITRVLNSSPAFVSHGCQ